MGLQWKIVCVVWTAVCLYFAPTSIFGNFAQENGSGKNAVIPLVVSLNPVTLGNKILWGFQGVLVPEALNNVIPMYVYKHDEVHQLVGKESLRVGNVLGDVPWYVGVADDYGKEGELSARPCAGSGGKDIGAVQLADCLDSSQDSQYIASNRPFLGGELESQDPVWMYSHSWPRDYTRHGSE